LALNNFQNSNIMKEYLLLIQICVMLHDDIMLVHGKMCSLTLFHFIRYPSFNTFYLLTISLNKVRNYTGIIQSWRVVH